MKNVQINNGQLTYFIKNNYQWLNEKKIDLVLDKTAVVNNAYKSNQVCCTVGSAVQNFNWLLTLRKRFI